MPAKRRLTYILTDHARERLRERINSLLDIERLIVVIMDGARPAHPEELYRVGMHCLAVGLNLYINESERCAVIVEPVELNMLRIVTVLHLH